MGETRTWLRDAWKAGVVLAIVVGLALFLRVYFSWNLWFPAGLFSGHGDYSGGSDPFYWERAMFYSLHTGKEISIDMAMNYPLGFPDVRPPLFAWFNLLMGYLIAPFLPAVPGYSGVQVGSVFMLMINAAIMGTLTLVPTYLIGKEAFGRRTGLIAALLLAISAAAMQRSHATIAVHDAWTLFFVVCTFYFYLRALKTLNRKRWVEDWFHGRSVVAGLRLFLQENRKPVLYALLAGMSVAVTALSWQGWAYVPVILVLVFAVELMLDRIRNQDTLGVTILFALILGIPLLVSFPWYSVRGLIRVWWDVPFYLFAAALVLGTVFSVTRDYPWTIVIPATFIAGGTGLVVGFVVNPALLFAFYSGAGYFVKNKVYQTIAEAQEPGLSELILSFGWITYFVGLAAVGWMVWQMPRRNNPAFTMLVFWTVGSLFMAVSAARFIFNASPAFAIATGWALDLILLRMDFAGMRRTYRSLAEGSRRNALRKSVKFRHALTVVFIVLLILLPNVWFAVDAAIPFDTKAKYDAEINGALPSFLRAPGYNPSSGTFYMGAFGYTLPQATQYFPAGYNWLSTQDTGVPLEQRPSVISWWDYGFEVTERGQHPVVADPFQNGFAVAGQFILAQNESAAVALMAIRLIEGDYRHNAPHLSAATRAVLVNYGLSPSVFEARINNPALSIPGVLSDPTAYGVWDSNLQPFNAMYIYLDHLLLTSLSEDRVVGLYHDLTYATGYDIGYFMVDTRLFPISAQNTGIFYAPVKLSDHRVLNLASGQVLPLDFFSILATTSRAQNIPIQDVLPSDRIQSETIQYLPAFYNSMFYRAYVGYSPTDLGYPSDRGIPGYDQTLQGFAPQPAWNMTHFRLVYRTAYYNPYTNPSNHTSAWQAMSYDEALAKQQAINAGKATGTVDLSTQASISNGLVILRYYDGAYVNGTVTVGGNPVPKAWVTVTDELGTPHGVTTTDANGHYSMLVPFGKLTLTVSEGNLTKTTLVGPTTLGTATMTVTLDQAMRVNQDLDGNGVPDWRITHDFQLPPVAFGGKAYFDLNHDSTLNTGDLGVAGATIRFANQGLPVAATVTTDARGGFSVSNLIPGTYRVTVSRGGHTEVLRNLILTSGSPGTQDLLVPFGTVTGTVTDRGGSPVPGATLTVADATNGTSWTESADANGTFAIAPLLFGNYNLTARSGSLSSLPVPVVPSASTLSQMQNLTVVPFGWVAGTTGVASPGTPHVALQFQFEADTAEIVTVISDAAGGYNVSLPAGTWDVSGRTYQGGALYAYLARVGVPSGGTASLSPSFQAGVRVNGSIASPGVPVDAQPSLLFVGSTGQWLVRGGTRGAYVAYLPEGSYQYQAAAATSGGSWASFGSVSLQWSRTLQVPLWGASALAGTVYWDRNGNGLADPGEGVEGARIGVQDNLGFAGFAVTNASGRFTFLGFANRTYRGSVTAPGFASVSIGPATLSEIGTGVTYALSPLAVAVVGRVVLNGTALLSRPVTIRATAVGGAGAPATAASQSDGSYSLSLLPGSYLLVVDENVSTTDASRYQNLGTDPVSLSVGEGVVTHDLVIAYRDLVVGNVTLNGVAGAANLSFAGPDMRGILSTTSGFRLYLQPGTYTAFANLTLGGAHYAVGQTVTVPASGNVSLALKRAVTVNGQLTYSGVPIAFAATVNLVRAEGGSFPLTSTASGTYTAYLAPGNYTLSVNATLSVPQGTFVRFYRYTFAGTFALSTTSLFFTYNVPLARALDNVTVSGIVTLGGVPVDASLSFIAAGGGALNASVAVPMSGAYRVGLAPGAYVLYATRALGQGAFLDTGSVPYVPSLSLNVALTAGFTLAGVTTDASGTRISAGLAVQGAAGLDLSSDATGTYSMLLPAGTYTVNATTSGTSQGVPISFTASTRVSLTADRIANLQLAKVTVRAVAIIWDSSQNRTVPQGGSVTYTIVVRNTGNVADSFALAGTTTGWTFRFSPAVVDLNYGNTVNATAVSVTITSPADALVNHPAVTVTATSQTDPTVTIAQSLIVGIQRVRGLTLRLNAASGTFDGRYLNYTVILRNTGNAAETVRVTLMNPSDVASSGWTVGLANFTGAAPSYGDPSLAGVVVPANGTTSVRLSLRSSSGTGGVAVALQAVAQDNPGVSAGTTAVLQLPALVPTTGIGVVGSNDVKTLPPNLELISALVGAVAAVGVGLFLTRRRR